LRLDSCKKVCVAINLTLDWVFSKDLVHLPALQSKTLLKDEPVAKEACA